MQSNSDLSSDFPRLATLIEKCRGSDSPDWNSLEAEVFRRLRRAAHRITKHSDASVSFGATSLTSEAFLRLEKREYLKEIRDVQHFFALMTLMMKQLFAEHIRQKNNWKNGGRMQRLQLNAVMYKLEESANADYLVLTECLETLKDEHPRQASALEMQFYLAMKVDEIANVLQVSKSTVESDLRFAKASVRRWLNRD